MKCADSIILVKKNKPCVAYLGFNLVDWLCKDATTIQFGSELVLMDKHRRVNLYSLFCS